MQKFAVLFFLFSTILQAQLGDEELVELYRVERNGFLNNSGPNININIGLTVFNDGRPAPHTQGIGFQSAYFVSKAFLAELMYWKATGDPEAFLRLKAWIDSHINAARTVVSGISGKEYKGYPSERFCPADPKKPVYTSRCEFGTPLWEFFIFRHIMHFLADIHYSPKLKAQVSADYGSWFTDTVEWISVNQFEKWKSYKITKNSKPLSNFYRSRTHMAMEAAEFCWYFWLVTGIEESKEIALNILEGGMPNWKRPKAGKGESFKNNLVLDKENNLYLWSQGWKGDKAEGLIQDVDHWGHFVSSQIMFYEHGYFTKLDMERFKNTMDKKAMITYSKYAAWKNVDGTDTKRLSPNTAINLFLLGQYDRRVNDKIANGVDASDANKHGYAAIVLYNQLMLDKGRPVYPEHYVPLDGPFVSDGSSNNSHRHKG